MNWLEDLREAYYKKGSFSHASPKRICLFPYTTSPITPNVLSELKSFKVICGESLRDLAEVDNTISCTPSAVIANIKDKVDTENFTDLAHIIKAILFDEEEQIFCFHPTIFYHLSSENKVKTITTLAQFTRDIFFADQVNLGADFSTGEVPSNVFHSLVLKNLPPLGSRKKKRSVSYYRAQDPLHKCFVKDCLFLQRNSQLYAAQLPELLKFYYFIYQLRLVESLNNFFVNIDQKPFFFSVDWESLSKGRQAFQVGWRRVDHKLFSIFSHTHCLEMLSYIPFDGLETPFAYDEIKMWVQNASSENRQVATRHVNELIDFYLESIEQLNFDWSRFHKINSKVGGENLTDRIKYFYELVHFQFENSNRKAASTRYSKWLSQFAVSSYLKRRGPLGHTLCFSRDQLLFLTRLCIGDNPDEKIRLTELWKEFSRRGVVYDFESQKQILNLFNQLNLIEKKSDSGDAQYVRAIF